jgi:hypothetical protein
MRRLVLPLVLLALVGVGPRPLNASSGKGEDELPRDLGLLYGALDRGDLGQHRELYSSAEALAEVRKGRPLPSGTELTMIVYGIARDAVGTPVATDGRFLKQAPLAYLLMRKRGGTKPKSAESADSAWHFQIFGPDKRIVRGAKLADCAACHEKRRDEDFIFSHDEMKEYFRRNPAR